MSFTAFSTQIYSCYYINPEAQNIIVHAFFHNMTCTILPLCYDVDLISPPRPSYLIGLKYSRQGVDILISNGLYVSHSE